MSGFQPPTPTYRSQVVRMWDRWKSMTSKPQLWGVYLVASVFLVVYPNPSALFSGALVRLLGMIGAVVSTLMVLRNWRWSQTQERRAQLTIPDMVFFGAALLVIAGLAEPVYQLLDANASELGPGAGYLLQMVVPGLLITLLIIFFAIASGGK